MKKKADVAKDVNALQNLDAESLLKELSKAQKELYLLTMKHQANELKQPHLIRAERRRIAQIQMVISAQ